MSFKSFQLRAFVQIPAPNSKIRTSCKQHAPRGVNRHACDGSGVTFHDLHQLAGFKVPGPRREISGPRDENVFRGADLQLFVVVLVGWNEDQGVDAPLVTPEHADTFPCVKVPGPGGSVV